MLPPGGTALRTWKKCRAPKIAVGAEKGTEVRGAVTLPSALWSARSPVDRSVHQAVLLNLTSMAAGSQHPEKCGLGRGFEFPETPRWLCSLWTGGGVREPPFTPSGPVAEAPGQKPWTRAAEPCSLFRFCDD